MSVQAYSRGSEACEIVTDDEDVGADEEDVAVESLEQFPVRAGRVSGEEAGIRCIDKGRYSSFVGDAPPLAFAIDEDGIVRLCGPAPPRMIGIPGIGVIARIAGKDLAAGVEDETVLVLVGVAVVPPRAAAEENAAASVVVEPVERGELADFGKQAGLRDIHGRAGRDAAVGEILEREMDRVADPGIAPPLDRRVPGHRG